MTVWLLVLALPVYAVSGVLLQLLGPAHRHIEISEPTQSAAPGAPVVWGTVMAGSVVKSLQAWRDGLQAQSHTHGWMRHAHPHASAEHHHHGVDDAAGQAAVCYGSSEGLADATAAAASGGAALPLALTSLPVLPDSPYRVQVWQRSVAALWRNADRDRLERPPRG